jgi:hypothetical protein
VQAFPVRLPSGSAYWTVLDDDLEQTTVDLRRQLEERTEELEAARATNRELMAEVNRLPERWPSTDKPRIQAPRR